MFKLSIACALALTLIACGDEGGGAPAPKPAGAKAKPAARGKKAGKEEKTLDSRRKAEEMVACPLPEKIGKDVKSCDAKAKLCEPPAQGEPRTYCLPYSDGKHYCLPCAERDAIRHVFANRDFDMSINRDPFESYVLMQKGLVSDSDPSMPREITKDCTEKNMVATNYGYQDLRLVGIVTERAQRRVLMMDPGNLGHIIKKNDCVGREKAIVKDIGAGFVTFQVKPEELLPNGQPRPTQDFEVQLYPKQLPLSSQPRIEPDANKLNTPVVAPPAPGAEDLPVEQPPASP